MHARLKLIVLLMARDAGMGKGAAEPRKPKAPLAELKIDVQTMNMKTVIKCANAKDRAKSNAAQLAKVQLLPDGSTPLQLNVLLLCHASIALVVRCSGRAMPL